MTVTQADKDAAHQWRLASDGRVQEPLEVILARHRIAARTKITAWLRRDTPEPSHLKAAGPRIVAACALDFADAITRHEHRKD